MLATYSASKAFLSTWSQALADEYKSRGIVVELVHTYFVVSAMSKIRKPTLLIPTAKTYVRSALKNIGTGAGAMPGATATTTPYWPQAFMALFIGYLPTWFTIHWTHSKLTPCNFSKMLMLTQMPPTQTFTLTSERGHLRSAKGKPHLLIRRSERRDFNVGT